MDLHQKEELSYQNFSENDIKALIHILLEYKDKNNNRMID